MESTSPLRKRVKGYLDPHETHLILSRYGVGYWEMGGMWKTVFHGNSWDRETYDKVKQLTQVFEKAHECKSKVKFC